jgi:hypothetical protein
MKWIRRAVLIVAAVGVGVVLAGRRLLESPCANELVSEVVSPDGVRKVVVFRRDCGATTAASIQASVLAADASLPATSGNLFVADARVPVAAAGGPGLDVSWTSPLEVVVRHDPRARVFKSAEHVEDVRASYGDLSSTR